MRYYKTLDGTREVEFVIEKDGGVIPIEVKSSNGATVSLNETLRMKGVPYGYKLVEGNVGVSDRFHAFDRVFTLFTLKNMHFYIIS